MEERVQPAAHGIHDHHTSSEPQPAFSPGTYVVQIPKDQIYRVPPPEHALIAERHRNPVQIKRSCCSPCSYRFIFIIIIILVLGLIAGILTIFLNPKNPEFYIQRVLVKKVNSHIDYDIKLKVENPNAITGIFYNDGGDASLTFSQREIGGGKFPNFYQGYKNSKEFDIVLNGSNSTLPKEVEKSMKSENSKVHISLSLSMKVPVSPKIGFVKCWITKIAVNCNLMVDTLAKNTHLLSQKCHTTGRL